MQIFFYNCLLLFGGNVNHKTYQWSLFDNYLKSFFTIDFIIHIKKYEYSIISREGHGPNTFDNRSQNDWFHYYCSRFVSVYICVYVSFP